MLAVICHRTALLWQIRVPQPTTPPRRGRNNVAPRVNAAIEQLKAEGYRVREEDVARLSPLSHEHINMLGRYTFTLPELVASGGLRPLRNPNNLLEDAA